MIRFNKDRNKIIKDIVNDLIEYQNTVEDWAGGEHTVHLTDKAYDDFLFHIGEYEEGLDIFPQYEVCINYDCRRGRGSAFSPKLRFYFHKRENRYDSTH